MAQANLKAVITAEDRASSVLSGLGNSFSKLASTFAVGQLAAQGVSRAFDTLVGAGKSAVESASNFEQTRIGLENMLGSADKARGVLKDVSKFAAETPFEFPELAGSVKQLVAFGFSGDDAIKTMKQLGDVSAAIGAPIGDLSYLMGTLKTQGRAFTIDIRQFAQRGIPIYEYLAKVLKVDEKAMSGLIEEGKIGFPEVQKAFELMTAEGGKFHGTMAKQSKSLKGLWSTLKDTIGQTGRELVGITEEGDVKQGSLFDKLRIGTAQVIEKLPKAIEVIKNAIGNLMPTLIQWKDNIVEVAKKVGDYLGPKLEALWNTITNKVLPVFQRLWKEVLEPIIPVIGQVLVAAIGFAIDSLNAWYSVLAPIFNWMLDHKNAVEGVAIAFAGLALAMKIDDIKSSFVKHMDDVMNTLGGVKGKLTDVVDYAGGPIPALAFAGFATAIIVAFTYTMEWINKVKAGLDDITNKSLSSADKLRILSEEYKQGKITLEEYKQKTKELSAEMQQLQKDADETAKKVEGSFFTMNPFEAFKRDYNALKSAFSGGGMEGVLQSLRGRAIGGPVVSGQPFLVGERGPELFIPPSSGSIVPNNKITPITNTGQSNINITIQAQAFAGSQIEARKFALLIQEALQDAKLARGMA